MHRFAVCLHSNRMQIIKLFCTVYINIPFTFVATLYVTLFFAQMFVSVRCNVSAVVPIVVESIKPISIMYSPPVSCSPAAPADPWPCDWEYGLHPCFIIDGSDIGFKVSMFFPMMQTEFNFPLPLILHPSTFGVALLAVLGSCLLHLVATSYFLMVELVGDKVNRALFEPIWGFAGFASVCEFDVVFIWLGCGIFLDSSTLAVHPHFSLSVDRWTVPHNQRWGELVFIQHISWSVISVTSLLWTLIEYTHLIKERFYLSNTIYSPAGRWPSFAIWCEPARNRWRRNVYVLQMWRRVGDFLILIFSMFMLLVARWPFLLANLQLGAVPVCKTVGKFLAPAGWK